MSNCDTIAWQRMVQLYGPLVYRWARRKGLYPQDAADTTQETLAAAFTQLLRYDADRPSSTFRGWLWTITRNKIADLARRNHGHTNARGGSTNMAAIDQLSEMKPISEEPSNDSCQVASDETNDHRRVVMRAIALLRSQYESQTWQAFWRTVVDGCSPEDVAEELGVSRWAVYKARSRILSKLREELNGLEVLE